MINKETLNGPTYSTGIETTLAPISMNFSKPISNKIMRKLNLAIVLTSLKFWLGNEPIFAMIIPIFNISK